MICHCLLTEMPPAAMALPRVSLLTCALRGKKNPSSRTHPPFSRNKFRNGGLWSLLVTVTSPASVCPCAHSAGRAGLCTPFISSRRLTLLRGPLQQNGYTVSTSQLKHSIVAFIVLEWSCKVNGFEGRGKRKKKAHSGGYTQTAQISQIIKAPIQVVGFCSALLGWGLFYSVVCFKNLCF